LVLLHPVGLDGTFWGDLPERCASTHRVVCVDLRGHGKSPPAKRPGAMEDYVGDIEQLIETLGGGPATLLGVSFGGMIAQHLAIKRPELVAGLVACACPGRIPKEGRQAILQRGIDAEQGGMEVVVEATLKRWFTGKFLASEAARRVRERLLSDSPSNFAAAWEAISGHDALDRLSAYRGPALVVAGDKDVATSLEASRALAAAVHARLEVLEDTPHIMQIERADLFGDVVLGFLREMERAA